MIAVLTSVVVCTIAVSTNVMSQESLPIDVREWQTNLANHRNAAKTKQQSQIADIRENGGRAEIEMCQGSFSVDPGNIDGDPHLAEGDEFIVVGPLPVSGNLEISPVGASHSWKRGHYKAVVDPYDPTVYFVTPVGVMRSPKHTVRTGHYYKAVLSNPDSDGCPQYITFFVRFHEGDPVLDTHPGHAGTSRN